MSKSMLVCRTRRLLRMSFKASVIFNINALSSVNYLSYSINTKSN